MNSHQRRITRRHWRYEYEFEDISIERYLAIRDWCKIHFGSIGFRWGNTKWYCVFEFRHQRDYSLFLLTWT